jgi:hypothetical protein
VENIRHGAINSTNGEAPLECIMTRSSAQKEHRKHDPYTRIGRLLEALDKLQAGMTVELWEAFIPEYARHYLHSLNVGEHPLHPGDYFNEWVMIRRIGQTPLDTDNEPVYHSRNFIQYESPKARFWL